jgi:hypothetical protein
LAIIGLSLFRVAFLSPGNLTPDEREDRGNRWALGFWTLDGNEVRWVEVVLFAAGGALRIESTRILCQHRSQRKVNATRSPLPGYRTLLS